MRGETLGGTGMSNPMKSFAQIESLLLKATPVDGGYRINGTLPWVSNLGPTTTLARWPRWRASRAAR
jgi:alkylation response protein AidB-like acyl-CoA dehydrogenase